MVVLLLFSPELSSMRLYPASLLIWRGWLNLKGSPVLAKKLAAVMIPTPGMLKIIS